VGLLLEVVEAVLILLPLFPNINSLLIRILPLAAEQVTGAPVLLIVTGFGLIYMQTACKSIVLFKI